MHQAERAADQAFALADAGGDTYVKAYVRGNQAVLYREMGRPDLEARALSEALEIARSEPQLTVLQVRAAANLAAFQLRQGRYREAIALADQAIALAQEHEVALGPAAARLTQAHAWAAMDDMPRALEMVSHAMTHCAAQDSKSCKVDVLTVQVELLERQRAYEPAARVMQERLALQEMIRVEARESAVAFAQEQFEAARKDLQIERLSLVNQQQAAQAEARVWQQRLWIAIAVGLALSALLLVRLIRVRRHRNQILEISNAALDDLSRRDALTGAYNRRHSSDVLARYDARRVDGESDVAPLALIYLDLDGFKSINDRYGHATGDAVLVEVVRRLRQPLRQQDAVVRLGGEEFLVLLPDISPSVLSALAARVLEEIARTPFEVASEPLPVTASIGAVIHPLLPEMTWERSLRVADAACYLSKAEGRNRASCVSEASDPAILDAFAAEPARTAAAGGLKLERVPGPVADIERRDVAETSTRSFRPLATGEGG